MGLEAGELAKIKGIGLIHSIIDVRLFGGISRVPETLHPKTHLNACE
jgi:hypothetical protein